MKMSSSCDAGFAASDEDLVKLIEKFPQLYDKANRGYRDKLYRENAWKSISVILNETPNQCERRFTILRNKYATLKRKNKEMPSGSGARETHNWPIYSLLGFLDNFIVARKRQGNVGPAVSRDMGLKPEPQTDLQTDLSFCEENAATSLSPYNSLKIIIPQISSSSIIIPPNSSSSTPSFLSPTSSIRSPTPPNVHSRTPTPTPSTSHTETTGLFRSAAYKRRLAASETSTSETSLSALTRVSTEGMAALTQYMSQSDNTDVEKSFGATIASILKKIKGKKKRKRAMNDIWNQAMTYTRGEDSD